ncbi:DUF7662 domain-containing protein [Actinoplanes flavus]|uniref:DUF7662 domain-containing protein n=1 Tax=Actinoplanes flavus TaxID=2820290 RepID=A0ABS3UMN4_9ACTN|nr:hypothetical protein [Actinoplanes flavus]MBO3739486.1 hypothetical protein [Actinoplanes flavus]
MPGKYQPLTFALTTAAKRGQREVEFSFDEIAALVGGLPRSAELRQWWANADHSQAQAWCVAGYRVQQVYLDRRRVRFSAVPTHTPPGGVRNVEPSPPRTVPGLSEPPVDIRAKLQWVDSGVVLLDAADKPAFPRLAASPGLYRLTFTGPVPQMYIGESDNLHRRLSGNYRSPGPSQRTSTRINALLREHLARGGTVLLATATAAVVVINDQERPLDLSTKSGRLLAESVALVHAQITKHAQIVNLG